MIIQNSSEPLYLQLKDLLQDAIRSGRFPKGSKLPSEKKLCEEFCVSRITVRKALDILENNGMTYSVHGKGTYVKSDIINTGLQKISTFGETLSLMGYSGFTKITHYEEKKADDFERMLRGNDWESVTHLSLTGYSMDEPVVLYRSAIRNPFGKQMYDAAKKAEKDGLPFSTFDLYSKIGIEIGKINQHIAAVNADKEIAGYLKIPENAAVLVLDSVIRDKALNPLEYKKAYYRTDKYSFNLNREL